MPTCCGADPVLVTMLSQRMKLPLFGTKIFRCNLQVEVREGLCLEGELRVLVTLLAVLRRRALAGIEHLRLRQRAPCAPVMSSPLNPAKALVSGMFTPGWTVLGREEEAERREADEVARHRDGLHVGGVGHRPGRVRVPEQRVNLRIDLVLGAVLVLELDWQRVGDRGERDQGSRHQTGTAPLDTNETGHVCSPRRVGTRAVGRRT
jgi:hypothetical protein